MYKAAFDLGTISGLTSLGNPFVEITQSYVFCFLIFFIPIGNAHTEKNTSWYCIRALALILRSVSRCICSGVSCLNYKHGPILCKLPVEPSGVCVHHQQVPLVSEDHKYIYMGDCQFFSPVCELILFFENIYNVPNLKQDLHQAKNIIDYFIFYYQSTLNTFS